MRYDAECDICREFAGFRSAFHRLHPAISDRSLTESPSFRVTPTIRPLSPGHLLIWTKEHVSSFSSLSEHQLLELDDLIERLDLPMHISFEHGVNSATALNCGVDHAHLHVLPMPLQDVPLFGERNRFYSYSVLGGIGKDSSYIFLKQGGFYCRLISDNDAEDIRFSSQYIRRYLAPFSVYKDAVDWREAVKNDPDVERLLAGPAK